MSALNIGRRKIEQREAEFVTVGDVIVDEDGNDWLVTYWSSHPTGLRIVVKRRSKTRRTDVWRVPKDHLLRVRRG